MGIIILEILKYLDSFGATFNFYIEKNRKLYTPLGGILTILAFFFSILIFIYINLDDFLRNFPNSTNFTERKKHRQIKFKEEKIWIPWRIRDFRGQTINHTDLLYPIIYYYKGRRNKDKRMITTYEFVNYKLCNETSMVNYTDFYVIDVELDQLYCIDMEDLDIGGSLDSDFFYLITLDIYACKNGIDYDENNTNCTTYDEIANFTGVNNSLEFEMYYPVVHYQPMNKTTPIFIEYTNYFYHLSRFSNKIDRLYLQQNILRDDKEFVLKHEKIYSRWGTASLNGDFYATGNKRDLMNEGSTSRFYSVNIYLSSFVIWYSRSYKKIYLIIAEGLPIINIVFIIFGLVAKVFKISSGNKKLTELLFENLKERKSFMIINPKKLEKKLSLLKEKSQINNKNITINKVNDISSVKLAHNESSKKNIFQFQVNNNNNNNSISNGNNENNSKYSKNFNSLMLNRNYNDKEINKSINSNFLLDDEKSLNNLNNKLRQNYDLFNNKKYDLPSPLNNLNNKNDYNLQNNKSANNLVTPPNIKSKTHYIKKKLFPYKYYLCSIFIKNIDISKRTFFFTKKFIVVYNFICQLFDISSYLILQREFQTMKNTVIEEKHRDIIEKGQKINVNSTSFNINMKECLDAKKLSIFGKVKQGKQMDY